MFLKPKQNAEFDDEKQSFVPSAGEIRIVANRNQQCGYYMQGIEICRREMLRIAGDDQNSEHHGLGFLPCKRLVDAHYRCLTEDKYGYTLEEVPEFAKQNVQSFFQCAFKKLQPMMQCRPYFDSVLRDIYRSKGHSLDDSY